MSGPPYFANVHAPRVVVSSSQHELDSIRAKLGGVYTAVRFLCLTTADDVRSWLGPHDFVYVSACGPAVSVALSERKAQGFHVACSVELTSGARQLREAQQ